MALACCASSWVIAPPSSSWACLWLRLSIVWRLPFPSLRPIVEPEGPQVTATVGLFLMLGTFASLILLVQHISTMLQAPNIAAAAGAELLDVVRARRSRSKSGAAGKPARRLLRRLVEADAYALRVRRTGYIQYIDPQTLLTLARERDLIVRLLSKPGHFVRHEAVVALVWPAPTRKAQAGLHSVDEQLEEQLLLAFRIGNSPHTHPGCCLRGQPARRNGGTCHVAGDQ